MPYRITSVLIRIILFLSLITTAHVFASPNNFNQAKVMAKNDVYFDRTQFGTFYCGCSFTFKGRSGGVVDLDSCGYEVRKNETRAQRIEWEHIVPASNFGRARQCWQEGGRKNCTKNDPVFSQMEADLFNLTPSVGEVNGDRSNYNFGMVQGEKQHGQCDIKVDFKNRTVEPRDEVKGFIARTYFYMHDRYQFPISKQQERLLMSWDSQFPVSTWELERNTRIAKVMGHDNAFVTRDKYWREGFKANSANLPSLNDSSSAPEASSGVIHGNKRSKVYHLPTGCPSYNSMSDKNKVLFSTEQEAQNKGFRKAGNCR